mmetsp:Transcript_57986/g.64810  ORF Transcript_57986/g.64810 Transcript_57986/m.64810 type:complete len:192 (+) Transcript_57986:542-1117(+)
MNDVADSLAKDFLSTSYCGNLPAPLCSLRLLHEKWTISIHDEKHSWFELTLCYDDAVVEPQLLTYWQSHHDIPIPNCDHIDWEPCELAVWRLPPGKKRWHFKFTTGCIGVDSQLFHWRYQDHSWCPLCNTNNEKVSHVLHYPGIEASAFASSQITHRLAKELDNIDTEPVLTAAILSILDLWRANAKIVPI